MALHDMHHVLDQQIALHLHDGRRRGTDKTHHEVVARLALGRIVFLVELGVVERDLKGAPADAMSLSAMQASSITCRNSSSPGTVQHICSTDGQGIKRMPGSSS
jgi:hypothetical protein